MSKTKILKCLISHKFYLEKQKNGTNFLLNIYLYLLSLRYLTFFNFSDCSYDSLGLHSRRPLVRHRAADAPQDHRHVHTLRHSLLLLCHKVHIQKLDSVSITKRLECLIEDYY